MITGTQGSQLWFTSFNCPFAYKCRIGLTEISFFFGMIIGSIYFISREFEQWNRRTIIAAILGLLGGISISFLSPARENDNLFFIFFCGIISVSGMTLPGLSGSFILILLGNYVLLLVDSVNALYDSMAEIFQGDFSFVRNQERMDTQRRRLYR